MAREKGTWRLDIIIMVLYQITLLFSAQLVFVIFLDYMPSTHCTPEHFCYKLESACLTDYNKKAINLCPASLNKTRRSCVQEHSKIYFYSAQLEYQQDCTDLNIFDISTATFIGTLFGNVILGILADKYGRRLIYFFSILFGIPCLALSAAIEHLAAFYIFRVLTGFAVAGTLTVGWTYATEMISPNRRLRLLALANWPNARILQVGLAYLSKEWRRTTYLSASITCLSLPILWYLPESPIWLEQKDKFEEASRARKRIKKISGGTNDLRDPVELTTFEKVTPARVLKNKKLRTSFIVIVFMYFYVGMAVYITDLNGSDMTKNLYLGQFLSGLVLSIGQFIIGMSEPYLTGMGRRILFLVSQLVAIICYVVIVVCLYTDWKGSFLYLAAYTLAYASQSICLESTYLALVELMPTDVRATVGAIANTFMKFATIAATLTKPLKFAYEPALFFINLFLGTVGIVVVFFFLEESREADMKMVGQTATGTVVVYEKEEDENGVREVREVVAKPEEVENEDRSEKKAVTASPMSEPSPKTPPKSKETVVEEGKEVETKKKSLRKLKTLETADGTVTVTEGTQYGKTEELKTVDRSIGRPFSSYDNLTE